MAHRARTISSAMYAWGIEQGYVKQNPFSAVRLAAPRAREKFLSRDEAGSFFDALSRAVEEGEVSTLFADVIRLLMLTGARKTEILGLRWSEIDWLRSALVLPPERTKAGGRNGERRVALSAPAVEILSKRLEAAREVANKAKGEIGEYVFPAYRGVGHAIGIRKVFLLVRARAGLPDLRIHDLRHSFASFAVADGASLFLISKLLGHASARTTERYAHLASDPLQGAVDQIARAIVPKDRAASAEVRQLQAPRRERGGNG